jgi:hypothetical protein
MVDRTSFRIDGSRRTRSVTLIMCAGLLVAAMTACEYFAHSPSGAIGHLLGNYSMLTPTPAHGLTHGTVSTRTSESGATGGWAGQTIRAPSPVPAADAPGTLPAASGSSLFVAASAHVAGSNDTNWRTDLGIHVIGHEDAVIDVELLRHGRDNSDPPSAELTLEAGRSATLEDVLESEFGMTGTAALRLTPRRGTVAVTSRTYNLLDDGNSLGLPAGATFGQFIPALLESAVIAAGDEGRIIQLSHDPGAAQGSRTNLGLVNATGESAAVEVDLFTAGGQLLGTVSRQLRPFEYRQLDRVFELVTIGEVADGYAVVRPITAGAAVFAYASIVDNLTGDPIAVIPRAEPAAANEPVYIVAAAHAAGAAGTNWRTDLELHNGGTTAIDCTVDLLEHGQANLSPESASVTLPAGRSRRLNDVLIDLFDFSGPAALRITPDQPGLTATSRTYNLMLAGNQMGLPAGATFGQYIAPVGVEDALSGRDQGRLIQLAEDDSSRTNLVLVNATSTPTEIDILLMAADGTPLGSTMRLLAPYEYRQLNRVFRLVTGGPVQAGYAIVSTDTSGGAFFALASVVDNATGDPVAVPAIRHRRGAPLSVNDAVVTMMDELVSLEQSGISLEDVAAVATDLGINGVLDAVVQLSRDPLTRTDRGLRADWGTGGVAHDGTVMAGSADLDLSGITVTSTGITGTATETFYGFRQDGHRPLTDQITWTADLDVGPSGAVAGDLEIEGTPFDPTEPGLATITGAVEIDTDVCPFYPLAGSIEFEIDDLMHLVTFGPQCDGSFGYEGPGGDLSQYHLVTIRVLNLSLELRFTDPDACGDQTFRSLSTFVWNHSDGSFSGMTYHDSFSISYPPIEETNEITVTLSSGLDRVGFTARTTVVDSQDPDSVRTRTTTITAQDLPILFTGFGFETRIPGPGICDSISVQIEETYSSSSCVKQLSNLACRESSGIVVTIY